MCTNNASSHHILQMSPRTAQQTSCTKFTQTGSQRPCLCNVVAPVLETAYSLVLWFFVWKISCYREDTVQNPAEHEYIHTLWIYVPNRCSLYRHASISLPLVKRQNLTFLAFSWRCVLLCNVRLFDSCNIGIEFPLNLCQWKYNISISLLYIIFAAVRCVSS